MIDWLEIRQFAIAEHVELEFENGFTTVTGETGSGKSIIVDAIHILLGHRSDNSYIRHNHDSAEIQAGFALPTEHPALDWLKERELDNDNECLLRRVIRRDKSSKGYINGQAVTATQLRDLGSLLVDIHGQNEHQTLLKKSAQLALIDSVAGNKEILVKLGAHYDNLADIRSRINTLSDQSHAAQERSDLLKFQIEELNELGPVEDEWSPLQNLHKKLGHTQELSQAAKQVADKIEEDDNNNINSTLIQSINQLQGLVEYDTSLKPVIEMMEESRIILGEAVNQLRPVYQDNELDQEEINRIENRFARFHSLARKHRIQPDALHQFHQTMIAELESLADPESELERLEQSFQIELNAYQMQAKDLSARRSKSAKHLASAVTSIMQDLGMAGGSFEIRITPTEKESFTRYGNETLEFLVTANTGQPLQSLSKVASGGELSRISLGIQVIMANDASVPTLIFDEVDVGIGGEVANIVGQKLKELGKTTQVLCITHLSQVAARGDHHFSVTKHGDKQVAAQVTALTEEQRIEEIARMTVGENITKQSLAQAKEMLESK